MKTLRKGLELKKENGWTFLFCQLSSYDYPSVCLEPISQSDNCLIKVSSAELADSKVGFDVSVVHVRCFELSQPATVSQYLLITCGTLVTPCSN